MFADPVYPIKNGDGKVYTFHILLEDPLKDPPRKKMYPLDAAELTALQEQIGIFLVSNCILPLQSPYRVLILFAKKKDGALRMCIDYR